MFKLKPGNVIQKLSKMTRKQAYTWGAVVIVFFIALLMLASFMGDADDTSFENLNARGYDLAQMPFVNDEAEAYLLASKYPDMQGNNSSLLYSAEEKAARQAEDAANEESSAADDEASSGAGASSTRDSSYSGRSGRGYSGRGGGSAAPTQVGQLGSASMGHASGSGVSSTFGAPRGDFSPYKSQEKGSETPTQLQNQNARKALYQFARGSRAAAGYQDGKGANAKRALMGGNIQGSEAFTDKGVDLSKTTGLQLDTNAPVTSTDLSNLPDAIKDAADKAQDDNDKDKQTLWDRLLETALTGLTNMMMSGLTTMMNNGIDAMFANSEAKSANKAMREEQVANLMNLTDISQATPTQKAQLEWLGLDTKDCASCSFKDLVAKNNPTWAQGISEVKTSVSGGADGSTDSANQMKLGVTDEKAFREALDKRAKGDGLARNSTFPVGMRDDGSFQTQQDYYHSARATAMGKRTTSRAMTREEQIRYRSGEGYQKMMDYHPGEMTSIKSRMDFMSENCSGCVVGSSEWNRMSDYYDKLNTNK